YADGVARLERDPLRSDNLFQLPTVNWLFVANKLRTTVARHIQEHAAGDDAAGPVGHVAPVHAIEGDFLRGLAAVPHAVVIPGVAERVEVRTCLTVIRDAVEVDDACAALPRI